MIQDTVSNPMLGKMRMQFWRDAVKQISAVRILESIYNARIHAFYAGQTS